MNARGNGLRASAYAVLMEVDETTGARMLDALAERQIAAYVVPAPGPAGTSRLILHVDASRRVPARIVLAGLTPARAADTGDPAGDTGLETPSGSLEEGGPGADPAEIDALFSQLVATFHDAPAIRSWPEAEDLPVEPGHDDPRPEPPAAAPRSSASAPPETTDPWLRRSPQSWDPSSDPDRRRRGAGTQPPAGEGAPPPPSTDPRTSHEVPRHGARRPLPPTGGAPGAAGRPARDVGPEPDDDHYVPPHLSKLRPTAAATRWAFTVMLIGLALLLVPTFLTLDHTTSTDVVGVACIVGATGFLLSRLRPDNPDDPDDGAIV